METLDKYLKQNTTHKMVSKYVPKMYLSRSMGWVRSHRHYDKVFVHRYLSNS